MTGHRVRWYVYLGDGNRIPKTATMRGHWPAGYDAECSCGWESRVGGGTRRYVAEEVAAHKRDAVAAPALLRLEDALRAATSETEIAAAIAHARFELASSSGPGRAPTATTGSVQQCSEPKLEDPAKS